MVLLLGLKWLDAGCVVWRYEVENWQGSLRRKERVFRLHLVGVKDGSSGRS